jgi:hypothetical protein
MLERSEQDIEAGRVHSQEEVRRGIATTPNNLPTLHVGS